MSLEVIVLAAGLGKRMRSDLPKVLHPLAGKPLLAHLLDTLRALGPRRIFVVHGHGAEKVRAALAADPGIEWVLQAEQLGTGHAVLQALPRIAPDSQVLALNGDVPLARADTLRKLEAAAAKGLAILTSDLSDPSGYGRVVRDARGRVRRIVEEKDASPKERRIREWYCGSLAAKAKPLAGWLAKMSNKNVQKEYYLTAAIPASAPPAAPIPAIKASRPCEIAGVNSRAELPALERVVQAREAPRLLATALTLPSPPPPTAHPPLPH